MEALELQVSELARAVEGLALVPPRGAPRTAVDASRGASRGASPKASVDTEAASSAAAQASAAFEHRLAALEERLAVPEGARGSARGNPRTAREQPAVSASRQRALDSRLSDEERVRALGELRFREDESGADARSPEVVAAMIAIAQASPDEDLRADIWRQLHRSTDPALRDPLLWSLQYDTSADVRSEAAESLDAFNSDPAVVAALRYAAENDPDRSVRKEASGSL